MRVFLLIRVGCVGSTGKNPYVEVDGLYRGVRIRKITNLSEDRCLELVKEADRIYNEVVGN